MLSAHWDKNMKSNLHTHTTYCDGKSTPEQIVLSAIKHGFDSIGFSGHGYTDFDPSKSTRRISAYISALKKMLFALRTEKNLTT